MPEPTDHRPDTSPPPEGAGRVEGVDAPPPPDLGVRTPAEEARLRLASAQSTLGRVQRFVNGVQDWRVFLLQFRSGQGLRLPRTPGQPNGPQPGPVGAFERDRPSRPLPGGLEVRNREGSVTAAEAFPALQQLQLAGIHFDVALPGSLQLTDVASVDRFLRTRNIPATRVAALLERLNAEQRQLDGAIQGHPEWQGPNVRRSCDGLRTWLVQLGPDGQPVRSLLATGTQVLQVDGGPQEPRGEEGTTVTSLAGAPVNWRATGSGANILTSGDRRVVERNTGGTTYEVLAPDGGVESVAFTTSEGVTVVRSNRPGARVPDLRQGTPRAIDAPLITMQSVGTYLFVPDRSLLPPEYRPLADRAGGWLPPPSILLRQQNPNAFMTLLSRLTPEQANAYVTAIMPGGSEQEAWHISSAPMQFDRHPESGFEGLRRGRGGCVQVADTMRIMMQWRGERAASLVIEPDHAACVVLRRPEGPGSPAVQAVVLDSVGVHYKPVITDQGSLHANGIAALRGCWAGGGPVPPTQRFIDHRLNEDQVSYEDLAARMLGLAS